MKILRMLPALFASFLLAAVLCGCQEAAPVPEQTDPAIQSTETAAPASTTEQPSETKPAVTHASDPTDYPSLHTYQTPASATAEAVHINQVGYLPKGIKRAIVTGGGRTFDLVRIHDDGTGEAVYHGDVVCITDDTDERSGDVVCYADFTEWQQDGTYMLYVYGDGGAFNTASYTFRIASDIYDGVRRSLLRALYYQRCGMALEEPYAEGFGHAACHADSDRYILRSSVEWNPETYELGSTVNAVSVDIPGGWHEAGDYSKSILSGACAIGDLLNAYRLWPDVFTDDTNIPESGNGVADILDEARYELEFFLKMQQEDGGFFTTAFPWTHPYVTMPEWDNASYYVWPACIESCGQAVGALGLASRVFRGIDDAFADTCLQAALRGWDWLEAHPGNTDARTAFGDNMGNGYGAMGQEGETRDERYWAAVEIYLCTGNESARKQISSLTAELKDLTNFNKQHFGGFGSLSLLLGGAEYEPDESPLSVVRGAFTKDARKIAALYEKGGYEMLIDIPGWTSNGQILRAAMILIVAEMCNDRLHYSEMIQNSFNYLLGRNALSLSFVTGFGTNSVMNPHHKQCMTDNIAAPIPGYMVGGVCNVESLLVTHKDILQYLDKDTPPLKSFLDDSKYYRMIEVEIDWNTYPVFVAAYIAANIR